MTVKTQSLTELAEQVVGPVLVGDDPAAAAEVKTFNLAVTHHPAVVVGATGADDVAAAVAFAVANGLPVAVQATGHAPITPADGAVLITTSRMQDVTIDAQRRVARVQAGVRWADVIPAAAVHGLAPLCGSSSHVGVVGYTLGGGIGPLARQYGFAADLVTQFTIVTADSRIRTVDATSDPDLFWAVRGAKGNFGIVTDLEFGLVPVTSFFGGAVFFAAESAADVLHSYRAWAPTLPERTTTSIAMLRVPDRPVLPEVLRGKFVMALRCAHNGSAEEGEALLAPMLSAGTILLQSVGAMPFTEADSIHQDPTDPMPAWDRGMALRGLPAEAVDALIDAAGPGVELPLIIVELRHLGGALARQPEVPNAVSGRDGQFTITVLGPAVPELAEAVPAAGAAVLHAVEPWATGTALLNFLGAATTPEQVAAAWEPATHRRLLAVKDAVDPANVFRFGHALR
jgi:FAD/FMN-containing dehydrogenase